MIVNQGIAMMYSKSEGKGFLIERLWPSSIRKELPNIAIWLKGQIPSYNLCRYFYNPKPWEGFSKLEATENRILFKQLVQNAHKQTVTQVYSSKNRKHNKELIEGYLYWGSFNMPTFTPEQLCKEIIENAQDAIIFADNNGIIRLWNSGAQAIFGYSSEEALGKTLDLIIPENLRERHWNGYRKFMSTGITRQHRDLLTVPAIRNDGTRISIEFTIVPLRCSTGELLGVAAIIRDVTARWQKEKAIKEQFGILDTAVKEISKLLGARSKT